MKINGDGDTYTAILMAMADAPDHVHGWRIDAFPWIGQYLIRAYFRREEAELVVRAGLSAAEVEGLVQAFLGTLPELAPEAAPPQWTSTSTIRIGGVEMPLRGSFASELSRLSPIYERPPASAYIRTADEPPASAVRRCPSCGRTDLITVASSREISTPNYCPVAICRCGWRGRERDLVITPPEDAP